MIPNIICNLVKLQQQTIGRFPIDIMSKHEVALSFRTIHLNPGRATGKTQAISTLARPGDLVIIFNQLAKPANLRDSVVCRTIGQLLYDDRSERRTNYQFIFVDEPSLCQSYNWYNLTAEHYILLGA